MHTHFISRLSERLRQPLPYQSQTGLEVLLPSFQKIDSFQEFFQSTPRICAVMLALYNLDNELHIPFILRPAHEKGAHGGQISFPGGGRDETDPHLEFTALREMREEIGVELSENHILGKLSDIYVPPSHSLVTPVVAFSEKPFTYKPDPKEVAEVVSIPLAILTDPRNHKIEPITLIDGRTKVQMPVYYYEGHRIWGATARILSELLLVIEQSGK